MSNKYVPVPPAGDVPPAQYAYEELQDLSQALSEPDEFLLLQTLQKAPARPREGLIVLADGVNWNPGSGAGFYGYRGGAWRFLG